LNIVFIVALFCFNTLYEDLTSSPNKKSDVLYGVMEKLKYIGKVGIVDMELMRKKEKNKEMWI